MTDTTLTEAIAALSRIEAQAEARGMRKAAEEWVNVWGEGAAGMVMAYSDHIHALADMTQQRDAAHDKALMERIASEVEDFCADDPYLAGHGFSAMLNDRIRELLNEV